MLKTLSIKDLAIVEALTVDFSPGLNVLTGETGAGKSILVGAVSLLLGVRTHADMVRTGEDVAVCEGIFTIGHTPELAELLQSSGAIDDELPPECELRVRREIYRKGGSRGFVNNRQIAAAELKALGERLGDLCGQHQHQSLLDPRAHVHFLDDYAGLRDRAAEFGITYRFVQANQDRLDRLKRDAHAGQQARELARFQIAEIRGAKLTPTEEEDLKLELNVLKNARRLLEMGETAEAALAEEEGSAVDRIALVRKELQSLAAIDPRLNSIAELLDKSATQLVETVSALRDYRRRIEYDPGRMEEIESRLASIFELKRKYGLTCRDILQRLAELEQEVHSQRDMDDQINELARELAVGKQTLGEQARLLSVERKKAAKKLAAELETTFGEIGLRGAKWRSRFAPVAASALAVDIEGKTDPVAENGLEDIEFEIETNPGEGFKPLVKIASGGELSRVMLALKAVGAPRRDASFLVFDEVDSGIGGEVAHAVGRLLKQLSRHYQVFLVSHLPQMASLADQHYRVIKVKDGRRVQTKISRLTREERVMEVARMMAAGEITQATRRHAAEFVAGATVPKSKK